MCSVILLAGISLSFGFYSLAPSNEQDSTEEFSSAQISNGIIKLSLFLPDPQKGYYRGTRFDWSGIISQVEYKGHTYFGEWKTTHDPGNHDDIVGPVEEFRTRGAALGYHEAKVGESFVKIGVGLLEKPDEPGYRFSHPYRIIKPGVWKINSGEDWIEFQQDFADDNRVQEHSPTGRWGYLYTKRISLTEGKPEFTIAHSLKNTGSKTIETHQYNHNFFVIDGEPIGKSYVLRFPFEVKAKRDLKGAMEARGNELIFNQDLEEGSLFTELEGFGTDAKDHEIVIENKKTSAGVKIKGDKPLAQFYFWTVKTTVCPEPYIELNLAPGEEEEWKTGYLFFTLGNEKEEGN